MPRDNENHLDEYIKYVTNSRGEPDDFDSWAEDNKIQMKKRKRLERTDDDHTE